MRTRRSGQSDLTTFGRIKQGTGLLVAGLVFGGASFVSTGPSSSNRWVGLAVAGLLVLGGVATLLRLLGGRAGPLVATGVVGLPATWRAGGSIPTRRPPRVQDLEHGVRLAVGVQPYRQVRFGGAQLRVDPGHASVTLRSWWYRLRPPSLVVGFAPSPQTRVVPVTSLEHSGGILLQSPDQLDVLLWVEDRPHALAALALAGFTISPELDVPVAPTLSWSAAAPDHPVGPSKPAVR